MIKLIVDFYKGLDTFNLIVFWGIIIVIILLLIFSFIMINKNKKLRQIIIDRGIDIDSEDDEVDLPIVKQHTSNTIIKETTITKTTEEIQKKDDIPAEIIKKEIVKELPDVTDDISTKAVIKEVPTPLITPTKENNIEINTNKTIASIEKQNDSPKKEQSTKEFVPREYVKDYKKDDTIKRVPYEKNLIKSYSLNQTSPIGISSHTTSNNMEEKRAASLYRSLNAKPDSSIDNTYAKDNYQKLREESHELSRTDYERKQEEDAIISFKELMQKKDQIEMVDEEEAVISIEELIKKEKEKLYNITKDEPNDKFINELKKFRSDL